MSQCLEITERRTGSCGCHDTETVSLVSVLGAVPASSIWSAFKNEGSRHIQTAMQLYGSAPRCGSESPQSRSVWESVEHIDVKQETDSALCASVDERTVTE